MASQLSTPTPTPTTFLNRKRASPTTTFQEPSTLVTPPTSITSSIASRYSHVINQRDGNARGAADGFQIQVDFNRGLWNFCGSKEQNVGRCQMWGSCYDEADCKDGCGFLGREDLDAASCSSLDPAGNTLSASLCATAYLTLDNNLGPFQYIACDWNTSPWAHYTASQADAAANPLAPPTTTSPSTIPPSLSPPTTTNPALATSGTTAANETTDSSSGRNSSNIGAIVGGVIGGLAVICAFIFAAWFVWVYRVRDRRKQRQRQMAQTQPLNGGGIGRSSSSDGGGGLEGEDAHGVGSLRQGLGGQEGYGSVSGLGSGLGLSPGSVSVSDSGYGQAVGQGQQQQWGQVHGYGLPFVSMGEMQQQRQQQGRTTVKDTEGGWGPRELDAQGHGGGSRFQPAHDQQQVESPKGYYGGPQEVLTTEKATELPLGIEVAELSSGWEDTHPHGRDGNGNGDGDGRPGTNDGGVSGRR